MLDDHLATCSLELGQEVGQQSGHGNISPTPHQIWTMCHLTGSAVKVRNLVPEVCSPCSRPMARTSCGAISGQCV